MQSNTETSIQPELSFQSLFNAKESSKVDFDCLEANIGSSINRNLRMRRKALKLDLTQSANLMGISRSQYQRYESGPHIPRLYQAIRWSLNTGVPTSWLFHKTP